MLPMMAVTMPMREDHSPSLEPVPLSSETCRWYSDIKPVYEKPSSVGEDFGKSLFDAAGAYAQCNSSPWTYDDGLQIQSSSPRLM